MPYGVGPTQLFGELEASVHEQLTFHLFFCFTINKLQSWWVFSLFACLKLPSYILHQWILSVLQFSFLHVWCCCNSLESVESNALSPRWVDIDMFVRSWRAAEQWLPMEMRCAGRQCHFCSSYPLRRMKSDSRERGDSIICLNTTSTNLIAQPFPQW